ncbi:hypothetical protein [Sulfobacillus harzensis]|uniref:BIG2 domain-containing protein n=1 Tax=Sulfobacillus harzensis TaxID=2729629 RepID=A0A7Y0Q282_9FIRM|nr:hypothetical protein [Sulfobacillus harzensis]NMP22202.1 hypothetical protein [Sulfobacillus harzensis]
MAEVAFPRTPLVPDRNIRTLLDTTNATDVLTWTPAVTGLFLLVLSLNVKTAATDVTVSVSYTDPDTGATTVTLVNDVSEPVGITPVNGVITAQAGQAITVSVTAGTANQVRVAGALLELR